MSRWPVAVPEERRRSMLPSGAIWRFTAALDDEGKAALVKQAKAEGVTPDQLAADLIYAGLGIEPPESRFYYPAADIATFRNTVGEAGLSINGQRLMEALIELFQWRKGWLRIPADEIMGPARITKHGSFLDARDEARKAGLIAVRAGYNLASYRLEAG